jgi:hypothetical protein
VKSAKTKRLPSISLDSLTADRADEFASGEDELLEQIDRSTAEATFETNPFSPRLNNLLTHLITEAQILRLTCEHSSPWQVLVFCFNKMFLWKPARILAELAEDRLTRVEQAAEEHFTRSPQFALQRLVEPAMQKFQPSASKQFIAEQLDEATSGVTAHALLSDFEPLRKKMLLKVEAVLSKQDGASEDYFAAIMNTVVGETQLKNYFGARPADSISSLSDKVRKRVIKDSVDFLQKNMQPHVAQTMA